MAGQKFEHAVDLLLANYPLCSVDKQLLTDISTLLLRYVSGSCKKNRISEVLAGYKMGPEFSSSQNQVMN